MSVVVFGSLNMDLVVRSPRLPTPGETILGNQFDTVPGGKGANQAVAVARQQVPTVMVGCVGNDPFGRDLTQALVSDGVDTSAVGVDADSHTGVAAIAVSEVGENHIIVVPGANGRVGEAQLTALRTLLPKAKLLLLQFEVPLTTVATAASLAHAAGVTVMLDPAPAQSIQDESLYKATDILTPNQVEAAQLTGLPVNTVDDAAKAATVLQQRGIATVVIKLGGLGVYCKAMNETFHLPAYPVPVVDTVAAGDAFNGGLAAALHEGTPLKTAIAWAAATAALSVTQAGAQSSLPTRHQVETFLKSVQE